MEQAVSLTGCFDVFFTATSRPQAHRLVRPHSLEGHSADQGARRAEVAGCMAIARGRYVRMTPPEFISRVIRVYREAKRPRFPHPRVRRGRAASVAPALEELVAYWLAVNLPRDTQIWVDQPVRFPGVNRIAWYFDIAIVRNGAIRAILDIKADIGWMRDEFIDICRRHRKRMQMIRGCVGEIRDRLQGSHRAVRVSNRCCHHIVIISGENISANQREVALRRAKSCEPELHVYVLSEGTHPNDVAKGLSGIRVNRDAFDLLLKRLAR